jgi:hypothetical protein
MKFWFSFLLLCTTQLASAANEDQCARIFPEKASRDMCEVVSHNHGIRTDVELVEKVRARLAEISAEEKEKSDAAAKMRAAQTKLENDSKSSALRLKGLYPGITLEKADEYHPGIATHCKGTSALSDSVFQCTVSSSTSIGSLRFGALDTLAEQRVDFWSISGKGDVIWAISVSLDSSAAMKVGAALAEKYKFGVVSAPIMTNRMGAKFENLTRTWRSGDLMLRVAEYGSSLDTGIIAFDSTRAPKLTETPKTKDL